MSTTQKGVPRDDVNVSGTLDYRDINVRCASRGCWATSTYVQFESVVVQRILYLDSCVREGLCLLPLLHCVAVERGCLQSPSRLLARLQQTRVGGYHVIRRFQGMQAVDRLRRCGRCGRSAAALLFARRASFPPGVQRSFDLLGSDESIRLPHASRAIALTAT